MEHTLHYWGTISHQFMSLLDPRFTKFRANFHDKEVIEMASNAKTFFLFWGRAGWDEI